MLEEAKDTVRVGPVVIAMTMIAGGDSGSGSADFLGGFEPAVGDTALQLFELRAHAVHRLDALRALERQALLGVDDEHAHARLVRSHLLDECLRRGRFFAGGDADRAFDPGPGGALNIVEHFTAAAAITTDDVAMAAAPQVIEVLLVTMPRSPTNTTRLSPKRRSRSLTTSGTVLASRRLPSNT